MEPVFFTHVSDDWYSQCGADKLVKSFAHFHPDLRLVVFRDDDINKAFAAGKTWDTMIPYLGSRLTNEGHTWLVHLDADSLVCGRLEDLLSPDYQLAGTLDIKNYGADRWPCSLNCGLVASTLPGVWREWDALNARAEAPLWEQTIWNEIFRGKRYGPNKILENHGAYYGVSSGVHGDAKENAAKVIYNRVDRRLEIEGKPLKIIHHATGHTLPKLDLETWGFSGAVMDYFREILDE